MVCGRYLDGEPAGWLGLQVLSTSTNNGAIEMAKLKVAVIGTGDISKRKHLPSWVRTKDLCELVAVMDINKAAAEEAAKQFGVPRAYDNLTELLAKEKPDIIDVVTPPKTHFPVAMEAMAAGANVMVEKPMAMNLDECRKLVEASKKLKVQMCIAHTDLFYRSIIDGKKLVQEGAIGEFRGMMLHLSTPTWRFHTDQNHWVHKLPGGVIGETGPHLVYLSMAFVKNISEIVVCAKKLMPEYPWAPFDDYRLTLVGENGISTAIATYTCTEFAANMQIIGSEAILKLDLETQSIIRYSRGDLTAKDAAKSALSEGMQILKEGIAVGAKRAAGKIPSTTDLLTRGIAEAVLHGKPSPVSAEEGMECIRILKEVTDQIEAKYGNAAEKATRQLQPA
jgi:predicted dehydrogenase